MHSRGTIILVPFPFTDLSAQRIRPALIVSNNEKRGDDIIVVFISSVLSQTPRTSDVGILASSPSFSETGLKVSSVVRCDKIATLDKRIVLGELGVLSKTPQHEVDKRLRHALGLEPMTTRGSSAGGWRR